MPPPKWVSVGKWLRTNLDPMYEPTDATEGRLLTCFERGRTALPAEKERIRNHVASKTWFGAVTISMVAINAAFVGIQADLAHSNKIADHPDLFGIDCVFFLFFFAEMVVRMSQYYWHYFCDSWNLFDYFVISLSLFDITAAIITGETGTFRLALAIRILRVARIVRYIKGMKMFYRLWMTIKGFIDAMRTMLWVSLMLLIIVYCCSIALLTVLQDEIDEEWLVRDVYFGTVFRCMWTIMQLITFDAWAVNILVPVMPISWVAATILFFMIIIGSFGVINVIVAVLVESARTNSEENKAYAAKVMEKMDNELYRDLGKCFKDADDDGSGELNQEEFEEFIHTPVVFNKMRMLGISMDEATELFEVIDADESGGITPEEYLNGLKKLRGQARGQDLVQLISFSNKQCTKAKLKVQRLQYLNAQADKVVSRVQVLGKQMSEELRERRHIEQRTQTMWSTTRRRHEVLAHLEKNKEGFYPGMVDQ